MGTNNNGIAAALVAGLMLLAVHTGHNGAAFILFIGAAALTDKA